MKNRTYRGTRYACYIGYFAQAIVNNLAPLLFIVFQSEFHITYSMISTLVLVNFITQLIIDVVSVKLVDRIGHRVSLCAAHVLCGVGFILLGFLPGRMASPFAGLLIATVVYAIGGGLIEVLVSPTVESLPGDEKASAMSLLHSFYCWGQVAVVLISTLALKAVGTVHWNLLPFIWAVIPLLNAVNFLTVPLIPPLPEEKGLSVKSLFSSKVFLIALILMACAGASELTMSQWASLFAEKSLGVSKVMGDLLGPCLFAVLMGLGRAIYGLYGSRLHIQSALSVCAVLCIFAYLLTALAPVPLLSLIGCGLCGLSVSLMWPGVYSLSSSHFKRGGTAMFALLATSGDLGCSFGPWMAGMMSDAAEKQAVAGLSGLKFGVLLGTVFPLIMVIFLLMLRKKKGAALDNDEIS